MTRLKFELDEDSESDVLKVTTYHVSLGDSIDSYHGLKWFKK